MNLLVKLTILSAALIAPLGRAGESRVQDFVLDDHKVYSVPVSAKRVTTISFPSPVAAIDGALVTAEGKTPALFQVAHTKGTAYFSVRALAKEATTNLNVRWNNRTYVFELRESAEPFYSVVLQSPPNKDEKKVRPLTPTRLLGLLDKVKAFPLLQTYHPSAVAGVEHRDLRTEPQISDCGEYEVQLTEAFRFPEQDTLVFHVTVNNRTDTPLQHSPELIEVRAGDRVFNPSLTDLVSVIGPGESASGYIAISGGPRGQRNDVRLNYGRS